jgi:hypothetical protein
VDSAHIQTAPAEALIDDSSYVRVDPLKVKVAVTLRAFFPEDDTVTSRTPTSSEQVVLDASLTALTLLADPASPLLERHNVERLFAISRKKRAPRRSELLFLLDCWRELRRLRASLKSALTTVYEVTAIGAGATQCLIDHFELWGD